MSIRDLILGEDDLHFEEVPVPEWPKVGGKVRIRTLSGTERDAFEQACVEKRGKNHDTNLRNIRAKLCSLLIVDPATGQRVFSDADADALGRKSAKALDRVFDAGRKLNGIGEKDVEELAGNCETGPSAGSTSA
ncbi:MAG: hypothetical protein A3F84_27785 [Candidatus Handelsmanbacteria bacterium RIFCSPLOWO2_12_FULL_64_10]|uniref:Tail assembly chaperone n=1 Tax=Handelsmanbacteria sp. (strain RIFCSPLOWO2_12_FULL_64_10) TaxID=1817868 RepID=A0A1F6C4J9_HANXR|nr:MAG: hypothetical protein A3F84_27785 [Candidatus Handelsmanbacteria bacterium RIFCSPLOWO2_12_FULL_64_10]